jgi:hypothetical protein
VTDAIKQQLIVFKQYVFSNFTCLKGPEILTTFDVQGGIKKSTFVLHSIMGRGGGRRRMLDVRRPWVDACFRDVVRREYK